MEDMNTEMNQAKKLIPSYAVIPLLLCVLVNFSVYIGTDALTEQWKHYDLTLPFDRMVPIIPAFSVIYIGCYIFWIVNYIMITRVSKEHCYRFIMADIMSRVVCAFFYIILPTTNVRPVLHGTDIFTSMLQWIYQMDAPTRLFPSLHCLVSWFCYVGIRGRKEIPKWYQRFSLIFAILVCVSTQVTKQHYIVDVFGGIAVAEFCYWVSGKFFGRRLREKGKRIVK